MKFASDTGVKNFCGSATPLPVLFEPGPYPDHSCHSPLTRVLPLAKSHTSCRKWAPKFTVVSALCQVPSSLTWLILSVLYWTVIGTTCEPMMYGFWPRKFGE